MDVVKIGERLKKARQDKSYSLRKVGEITGLDYSYLGKIENGKVSSPSLKTLEQLCRLYDIKEAELFGEQVEVPKELEELGVEWIAFAEEMKKQELTPDEIKKYVEIVKKLKKDMS